MMAVVLVLEVEGQSDRRGLVDGRKTECQTNARVPEHSHGGGEENVCSMDRQNDGCTDISGWPQSSFARE